MAALHGSDAGRLVIHPNVWAGIGLVRGGAGTAIVGSYGEVADRLQEYLTRSAPLRGGFQSTQTVDYMTAREGNAPTRYGAHRLCLGNLAWSYPPKGRCLGIGSLESICLDADRPPQRDPFTGFIAHVTRRQVMSMPARHGLSSPVACLQPILDTNGAFSRLFPECSGLRIPKHVLERIAASMRGPDAAPSREQWNAATTESDPLDDPNVPAGYTYLGQFIDHDVTFDTTSNLTRTTPLEELATTRSPRLDLDSVYRGGPSSAPWLYQARQPEKLLIGSAEDVEDLPRTSEGLALIGDPRNDENRIIGQLHLAFLQLHNRHVDATKNFEDARRVTTWTYQWIVLHDYLPRICGRALVDELLSVGPAFFKWPYQSTMPLEFSVAAFRFGHSMVRPAYALQEGGPELPIFGPADGDLRGGSPLPPERVIEWATLFDIDSARPAQRARRVDTKLTPILFGLFGEGDAREEPPEDNLALRNLMRGVTLGLASFEAIHRAMSETLESQPHRTPIGEQPNAALDEFEWGGETPLWYGILNEAAAESDSVLGPVGARIVAETLFGLLEGDPTSFLRVEPTWQPDELPTTAANLVS